MAKRTQRQTAIGIKEFFVSPKWIKTVEKSVDRQIRSVRNSFDKNIQKATKSLNITTKKDLNLIHSKFRSLENRIERLEEAITVTKPMSRSAQTRSTKEKTKR